jgi:spermidine/putrescine transport system ATP-binding protein
VGPDERIVVPVRHRACGQGDEIEVTVRPEKIGLSLAPPAGAGCVLRGTVTEVVYLGTSTNFNVTTSTGADVVVFVQNAAAADDDAAAVARRGDPVWLSWPPRYSYAIGSTLS